MAGFIGDRYMTRHREGKTAIKEEEGHRGLVNIEGNVFLNIGCYNMPSYLEGRFHFSLYSIQCAWPREKEREGIDRER